MSEVRKWYIGVYGGEAQARTCSPHPNEVIRDREGDTFVLSRDHMVALASANSDKEAYAQNAIDLRKRVDALQALLTAANERADRLEADKKAMTETHVLYTWLRKKCDQPSNDVVAVHMNIGHDWVTVYDLDTDLRAMIEREEP